MTYGRPATCRRGGCGNPVSEQRAECEGDLGWCDFHRGEVRQTRHRLTVGTKTGQKRKEQM